MTRVVFGGLIALILLALYAYSMVVAIVAIPCLSQVGCQPKDLGEGVLTVLNLVGGLVSALVVAELAVTQPGQPPAARLLVPGATRTAKTVLTVISISYVLVWLVCGVVSVVVGYVQHPNVVPALTAAAKSWLGIAVAAAYSYLGIRPSTA